MFIVGGGVIEGGILNELSNIIEGGILKPTLINLSATLVENVSLGNRNSLVLQG